MIPYYITVSYPSSMHPGPNTNCPCVDVEHGIVEHTVSWTLVSFDLVEKLVKLALKHNQRFEISGFSGEHLMYPVRKYTSYQELVNDLYPGLVGSPFTCNYYFAGRWEQLNYSQEEFMKRYNL